jgi:hypothetical protein
MTATGNAVSPNYSRPISCSASLGRKVEHTLPRSN